MDKKIEALRNFLAKETFKMAHRALGFAAIIKCVPFELEDSRSLRVKMFSSLWKTWLWHVVNFIYWISTAYRFITFCVEFAQRPLDEELIVHGMYVVITVFGSFFLATLYLKPEACVVMFNQHDFLLQATRDAGVRIPHWTTYNFSIMAVLYFAWTLLGIWSFFGIYFLLKPDSSHFICSDLPQSWQESYVVMAVMFMFEQSKLAWNSSILCAFFCYWCADIYTLNSILAALMKKQRYTGAHVTLFHYMQIFLAAFNDFNGTVFTVCFNCMIVVKPTFFIYMAISAKSLNPFFYIILLALSSFSIFLIMYFIPQDAKVRFRSVRVLAALRAKLKMTATRTTSFSDLAVRARNNEILNKRVESFRPLGIDVWFFGVYSLSMSIQLLEQLCNNLLLLLSL